MWCDIIRRCYKRCTFITRRYEMFQLRSYFDSINDGINHVITIIAGDFKYIHVYVDITSKVYNSNIL